MLPDQSMDSEPPPTPGAVLRRARERRGLTVTRLAALAGLSPSFVTRLERDTMNPTWRTIQRLAQALECTPLLRLAPDQAAVAGAQALVAHATPLQLLLRQPVNAVPALDWLAHFKVPHVVTGAVAALLQGFPTPVVDLRVSVRDDDTSLTALGQLLLSQQLLFGELEPDELRDIVAARSWTVGDCEVWVTLTDELPRSTSIDLGDDIRIAALPPYDLLDDPEVASTIRISPMRSSDL